MNDKGRYNKTRQLESVATTIAVGGFAQSFLDAEYISHMLVAW